jgi:hypothetical protein
MKKILSLAAGLIALNQATVFAQMPPPTAPNFQPRPAAIGSQAALGIPPVADEANLPQFDLDFQGGPPGELVKQIEKATGKPLNVIIRPEDAQEDLPPLKMNSVTVPELFNALEIATRKNGTVLDPRRGMYDNITTGCGFKCPDNRITENSIWFFHVERPENVPAAPEPKAVQYFSLAPYLDRGFTVDDITTAIQAGWKMAGANPVPELNYHKETKMLIAYGGTVELDTIRQVLQTLPAANANYWRQVDDHMKKMQDQIDQLKQQLAATSAPVPGVNGVHTFVIPPDTNLPADKSGK